MDKTRDIQDAIRYTFRIGEIVTLDKMMEELLRGYPTLGEDTRWIGVAMTHLTRNGNMTYVDCSGEHNHKGSCKIQRTRGRDD